MTFPQRLHERWKRLKSWQRRLIILLVLSPSVINMISGYIKGTHQIDQAAFIRGCRDSASHAVTSSGQPLHPEVMEQFNRYCVCGARVVAAHYNSQDLEKVAKDSTSQAQLQRLILDSCQTTLGTVQTKKDE